ncbi:MAG: ABC transporter permease [Acidobacteriaceae bacterium]|nr:ABC transporter permease [Acidobacteriaceae bacterium]
MPIRRFYRCCRNILRRGRIAEDLDEELRSYIEMVADEKERAGRTSEEAIREACRETGKLEQVKERVLDVKAGASVDRFFQDLGYGLRMLRRNPGFAIIAITILALGIGATTAIFSVVDAVVFKPLPFPNADRLVRINSVLAATGNGDVASYPDFLDWRTRSRAFERMAAFRTNDFTLVGDREAVHLHGAVVSAELFPLLGVKPLIGRSFLSKEDEPSAASGANPLILSYSLWQREFSSDTSVLGVSIRVDGHAFIVVGVMPQGFQFPIEAEPIELWTTIAVDATGGANAMTAQRGAHYLDVEGLLKPNASVKQAEAEMAVIATTLSKEHPENKARSARVVPEVEGLAGKVRAPLLVLLGAVCCVLLIVCVNVASLLLGRAVGRRKEMAIRAAVGASRGRVISQLLTESLALSLLGGALGLVVAVSSLGLLRRILPPEIPRLESVGINGHLLIFALVISTASGIVFGLAPALQGSRVTLTEPLSENWGRSSSGGKAQGRLRGALVIGEVALAVTLLLGAGLLIQSFLHLIHVDLGFDPNHVLTFEVNSPPENAGASPHQFFGRIVQQISTIPGVSSASADATLPLTGDAMRSSIELEGQPMPLGSRPSANFNVVEPGFFRTLRIKLIQGRDFTEYDNVKSTPVVIVNRALAQRFFANQNPIGKHVRPGIGNGYGPGEPPMREIIGVIGDISQGGVDAEASPEVYAPLAQSPFGTMFIALRTSGDAKAMVNAVRRQVMMIDKNTPIYHVKTLDQYLSQSFTLPRVVTLLLSGFGSIALILACLGVYGVVSYVTLQRTREVGIRIALGAPQAQVLMMIMAEGLRPALLGIVIGVGVAFKLTGVLASLLFRVKPTDLATFAAVSALLAIVTLMACYIPARRAAKTDPMCSLRYE